MADDKVAVTRQETEVDDVKKAYDVHDENVVVARYTDDDMFRMSKEVLNFWSPTGWKIAGIMFVMGKFSNSSQLSTECFMKRSETHEKDRLQSGWLRCGLGCYWRHQFVPSLARILRIRL